MGAAKTTVGEALAAALGWHIASGDDPHALHTVVAQVLGRREHRVVASGALSAGDQTIVRGDLLGVRFVDLADQHGSTADIVGAIRHEFGL